MRLDPADIEAIAQRVAQLTGSPPAPRAVRYVDAAQLARLLGVERDWIYAHAVQLGAIRLGGPKGRLRFDVQQATRALTGPVERKDAKRPARARSCGRRRRSARPSGRVDLLRYES